MLDKKKHALKIYIRLGIYLASVLSKFVIQQTYFTKEKKQQQKNKNKKKKKHKRSLHSVVVKPFAL